MIGLAWTRLDHSILAAFPRYMRHVQSVCLFIAGGSFIASAFVTKPWQLILTVGIFYPFAGGESQPHLPSHISRPPLHAP